MKHTTLIFLRQNDQILLAMKKRGFGVGKWNGPGGKVEPNETYEEAAVRECQEEVGITPTNHTKVGEFHFFDHPDIEHYCHIYVATEWEGELQETEEMRPKWFNTADIPYHAMWPDDEFWMPHVINNKLFKGRVVIGPGDVVEDYEFYEVDEL
ncbi:MAG TPA: 8-oxo-dGTP diphosphatase [Candidatus Saccharimonadales bacterium]